MPAQSSRERSRLLLQAHLLAGIITSGSSAGDLDVFQCAMATMPNRGYALATYLSSAELAAEDDEYETRILLLTLLAYVENTRYLQARPSVPRTSHRLLSELPRYSDDRFRELFRCSKDSYHSLVASIEDHPVFSNARGPPQAPVAHQLLLALWRLGSSGNGSSFVQLGIFNGCSTGHVFDCTRRVVKALRSLLDDKVNWPTAAGKRRERRVNERRAGFAGCIGKVDSTGIVLAQKPGGLYDGESFCNEQQEYAVDLCAVCDSDCRFLFLTSGVSNACDDARVWGATVITRYPGSFFQPGEYLLGDEAYAVTEQVVVPFKAPANRSQANAYFNERLSSVRIDIDHAFGQLKGRFQCLNALRIRIQDEASFVLACEFIMACCVLHNMLIDVDDQWIVEDAGDDARSDHSGTARSTGDQSASQPGTVFRESVRQQVLVHHDALHLLDDEMET